MDLSPTSTSRGRGRVGWIWHRLGISRLPASPRDQRHARRWKRFEKPVPGHRIRVHPSR
jgi:hypothetical protein